MLATAFIFPFSPIRLKQTSDIFDDQKDYLRHRFISVLKLHDRCICSLGKTILVTYLVVQKLWKILCRRRTGFLIYLRKRKIFLSWKITTWSLTSVASLPIWIFLASWAGREQNGCRGVVWVGKQGNANPTSSTLMLSMQYTRLPRDQVKATWHINYLISIYCIVVVVLSKRSI